MNPLLYQLSYAAVRCGDCAYEDSNPRDDDKMSSTAIEAAAGAAALPSVWVFQFNSFAL